MNLADKKILVTGANGFIGSHLIERLAQDEGARVQGLVRRAPTQARSTVSNGNILYFQADVTDRSAVARAAAGCDIIVHTAACQPFAPLPPVAQFTSVNVGGTCNLIQSFELKEEGRFLLLSTINVHGLPPPPGANADSPLKHSGDRYSDSKVSGERAAWQIARERGIPLTVIRPACTFGPAGSAWTIQPLKRLRRGTPVLLGSGRGICNPMYVDNLIDLIITALKSDAAANESFVGSQGEGIEWREFYGAYARMLGTRPKSIPYAAAFLAGRVSRLFERATGRPGLLSSASVAFYSHRVTFDISKNEKLLGYKPRISFQEGIRRTEEWFRKQKLI